MKNFTMLKYEDFITLDRKQATRMHTHTNNAGIVIQAINSQNRKMKA